MQALPKGWQGEYTLDRALQMPRRRWTGRHWQLHLSGNLP
jgi:hypothetical protein